ncbi:MAG: hypothetical protein ACRD18_14060 [Terriglobia bacterium]
MKIADYYDDGRRSWFRFHEKGGKRHEVPAHHNAQAYVDAYAVAAKLKDRETKEPLFRSVNRKRELTDRPLSRVEVFLPPQQNLWVSFWASLHNALEPLGLAGDRSAANWCPVWYAAAEG